MVRCPVCRADFKPVYTVNAIINGKTGWLLCTSCGVYVCEKDMSTYDPKSDSSPK